MDFPFWKLMLIIAKCVARDVVIYFNIDVLNCNFIKHFKRILNFEVQLKWKHFAATILMNDT